MKKRLNSEEVRFILNGNKFEAPIGGSLGLLALGDVGVRAWRNANKSVSLEKINEKSEKK